MLQIKTLYQSIDSIEVTLLFKYLIINVLRIYSQSIHSIKLHRKPMQNKDLRSDYDNPTNHLSSRATNNRQPATSSIRLHQNQVKITKVPISFLVPIMVFGKLAKSRRAQRKLVLTFANPERSSRAPECTE
jgi:hypothetical protein